MKPIQTYRNLIILILALVSLTFLTGVLRTFDSVHAAVSASITTTASGQPDNADRTPTPAPTPALVSADTTGIIALTIVIVIIVLVGTILGRRKS